jgi:hypothetical protein
MSQVSFGSLAEGSVFNFNGAEYKKIAKVKVSCCRFTNAQSTSSPNRIGLKDSEMVEVSNGEQA